MTDKQFAALINQLAALRLEMRSNNSFYQTQVANMLRADGFAQLAKDYLLHAGGNINYNALTQSETKWENDVD